MSTSFPLHKRSLWAYDWVASSGVYGASTINIQLNRNSAIAESPYTVRLHFAEMNDISVNQRVFDVSLQSEKVLTDFDVLEQAGSARHAVVKEFRGILAGETLKIDLTAKKGITGICGVEIIAEESAATTE